MTRLLIVLTLRLVFSLAAIGAISVFLSALTGTAGDRGVSGKRSFGMTFLAWIMVEALIAFYDLLPSPLWLVFCFLGLYLHTGVMSRLYDRDMKSAFPTALFHAGTILVALLFIIHVLEGFWRTGTF